MSSAPVEDFARRLRAAACHDAASEDDRTVHAMRTGRPWSPELPDLLICGQHTPCRILSHTERAAVENVTGPIPVPALSACRARSVLKRWAVLAVGEWAS